MNPIFIFGHKHPDTDSVVAAISLAYLKTQQGINSVACVLGEINNETKFALEYFKVKVPKYLNDVKLQIKDLDYKKEYYINEQNSIYDAYQKMYEVNISTIPIVNNKNKFIGMVAMKDIARSNFNHNQTMINTSYQNILTTIDGREILSFNAKINGSVILDTNYQQYQKSHIVVSNQLNVIKQAISKHVKLIIIADGIQLDRDTLMAATTNKINIISANNSVYNIIKQIGNSNYVITIKSNRPPQCLLDTDYINDFIELSNVYKYSNYPVVNKNNECLGVLRYANIFNKDRKKVILVDHNELEQSADGIEEANIIEIIDHHKIQSINTKIPINFRNMPVGSTSTIIFKLYQESNISIPKNMAGIMLSGILSDTLILTSPTTTEEDRKAVEVLSKIINIDYYEFGIKLFEAGTSLKNKTIEEIFYSDFKKFTENKYNIGISQIITLNSKNIKKNIAKYTNLIESISQNSNINIVILLVTDIIANGSYIFFNIKAKEIIKQSFNLKDTSQGQYIKGCVSRKNQVIPNIINTIEKE